MSVLEPQVALRKFESAARRSPARRIVQHRRHRRFAAGDVFLASYPKSGNTWLRHLLTIAITGQRTNWRGDIDQVSALVGSHHDLQPVLPRGGRLIKTHEPFRSSYRKAVYLVRDPRDVLASEFSYQRTYSKRFAEYGGSFSEYVDRFVEGTTTTYGSWGTHAASWHPSESGADVFVLRFEDLRNDPATSLSDVLEFLNYDGDAEIELAVEDTTLEAMREKEDRHWRTLGKTSPSFIREKNASTRRFDIDPQHLALVEAAFSETLMRYGYDAAHT